MRLGEFNKLSIIQAKNELLKCCGSNSWADKVMEQFPFSSINTIKSISDIVWFSCKKTDWLEAFSNHPKIGEKASDNSTFQSTKNWAENEQSGVQNAKSDLLSKLAEGNKHYADKFGFIFIICATGKSAEEMFENLNQRMNNDIEKEIRIAAEEQNKITHLRIDKLFT
jgi:2-oxo-4-hydroxy-4-carboxy-5-ureidoimidazoline decarboxylase